MIFYWPLDQTTFCSIKSSAVNYHLVESTPYLLIVNRHDGVDHLVNSFLLAGNNNLVPEHSWRWYTDAYASLLCQCDCRLVEWPTNERVVDLGDRQTFKCQLGLQQILPQ